VQFGVKLR